MLDRARGRADTALQVEHRFQRVLLSWLLVLAIGGHWPFLQSVAWVKMLVTFSQTENFSTAVEKTFDGKHPCSLCHFVAKAKETQKKQSPQVQTLKFDLFLVQNARFLFPPRQLDSTQLQPVAVHPPPYPPDRPPPKLA